MDTHTKDRDLHKRTEPYRLPTAECYSATGYYLKRKQGSCRSLIKQKAI